MEKWLEEVEPLTLKGQIAVPYTWWVGETGSRFLIALRDEGKILGNRCDSCGTVYVPPRKSCGRCFVKTGEWVELDTQGVVEAFTIVRFSYALQPAGAPFAYALIKLDGASVSLLHLIKKDLERLKNGVRVQAIFKIKKERQGDILDIDSFEII